MLQSVPVRSASSGSKHSVSWQRHEALVCYQVLSPTMLQSVPVRSASNGSKHSVSWQSHETLIWNKMCSPTVHGKSLIICCENSPCKKWLSIVGREKRQKDNSIIYLISYCIVSKNVSRLFLAKERIKTGHSFMVLERLWKTSSTFYGLPYFFWLPDFLGFYASSPLLVDVV